MEIDTHPEDGKKAIITFTDADEHCLFVSDAFPLLFPRGIKLYCNYLRAIHNDTYPHAITLRHRTLGRVANRLSRFNVLPVDGPPVSGTTMADEVAEYIKQAYQKPHES